MRSALRRVEQGLPIPDARMSVAELGAKFLRDGLRHDLATNTKVSKEGVIKFIDSRSGGLRVFDLKPSDVASVVNEMLAEEYSVSYAGRVRSTLTEMLDFAEAEGLVARNVAKLAPTVGFAPKERERLTVAEAQAFVNLASQHTLGAAIVVMLTLGVRPGEAMGFCWGDVDLDQRVVHLRQSLLNRPDPETGKRVLTLGKPKTRQSARSIRLPDITTREFQRHKAAQNQLRLAAGIHWRNDGDLVFTTSIGTPIDPANLRRAVREISGKAGITKKVVPYDFRRSAASLWSAAQVPGEQIADLMGNDAKTAMSVYRRRMEPIVEPGVSPMDDLLGSL